MRLNWAPEAVEEFLEMEDKVQKNVLRNVEKLPNKSLEWDKVELIERQELNFSCYRIKIDPEDHPKTNHRVLFKTKENQYLILKIGKRPDFYDLTDLKEAKNRL